MADAISEENDPVGQYKDGDRAHYTKEEVVKKIEEGTCIVAWNTGRNSPCWKNFQVTSEIFCMEL